MPVAPTFEGRLLHHPDEPVFDPGLSSDNVFGEDDAERQIGTISGSVSSDLTVDLAVPVRAS